MASPLAQRGWLFVPAGLVAGVVIGGFVYPAEKSPSGSQYKPVPSGPSRQIAGKAAVEETENQSENLERELFPGADSGGGTAQLTPEKLLEVFDRVSNLKSDSRKYVATYRLVSQMGSAEMEKALEIALVDWKESQDYTTTRAVARRWADLDPQSAVKKGVDLKNYHILQPALETWLKTEPGEPLKWALQQDAPTQAAVIRQMLEMRTDFNGKQVEQLVIAASDSPHEIIRSTILPQATARLAEQNPAAALHAAENLPDSAARTQMISSLMARLGKTQPDVAASWLSSQANLPVAERKTYEKILRAVRTNAPATRP
jgi:hypothetical protein